MDLASLHPAAQALAAGGYEALGVGLSGSGFLAFYFVGVLSALRDLGLIDQAKTKFAGASGGAIIALASTLRCPYETCARGMADHLVDDCEATGKSCFGTLDAAIKGALVKALEMIPGPFSPQGGVNATVMERVNGRTFVAVSLAPPSRRELVASVQRQLRRERQLRGSALAPESGGRNGTAAGATGGSGSSGSGGSGSGSSSGSASSAPAPAPAPAPATTQAEEAAAVERAVRARASKTWLVSEFTSVEDGISAARASAFIPGFSRASATTTFRGRVVFDGMLTTPLPCPTGVRYCVRVSAVPRGESVMGLTSPILEADVAPGLWTGNGTGRFTKREWDSFTLTLKRVPDRRDIERMGYGEGVAWARANGLADPALNRALAARGESAAAKERAAASLAGAAGVGASSSAAAAEGRTGNGGVAHAAGVADEGASLVFG